MIVTGQDAELAACQRIARGTQSMTIYKPLKVLATKAAENAVALAKGKPLIATATVENGKIDVPSIFNPVYTVTKENLRSTVIKDGFHSEAEVFGSSGG
jgi:D-xylose transport system substrate-binding protein